MILFPMADRKLITLSIYAAAAVFAFLSIFGLAYRAWPELSDSDKPELTLSGVREGGRYTGLLSITFSVKDETTSVARVRLSLDDAAVYDKAVGQKSYFDGTTIDTTPLSEGEHHFVISVSDGSLWKQIEERTIAFQIDHTPPRVTVRALKESVSQGDTAGFVIRADEALSSLQLEAFGEKVRCYEWAGRSGVFRGLFAVSTFAAPAVYEVTCLAKDLAGNETADVERIKIVLKRFPFETIELPKEKQGILSNVLRIREDQDKIKNALAEARDTQLWRGTFIRPAPGVDSSPFGIRRVYETGGVVSTHRGIDIANKEGTPIRASNCGAVLLAAELFVDGNTVILDHGQGVVSLYFHMKQLAVKKGDIVAKGATLGLMGTTGLSTGFHCHWEMQICGQSVNPDDWRTFSFEPAE